MNQRNLPSWQRKLFEWKGRRATFDMWDGVKHENALIEEIYLLKSGIGFEIETEEGKKIMLLRGIMSITRGEEKIYDKEEESLEELAEKSD